MFGPFLYILELKKEFIVVSLSVLYITYYLLEVVKKPMLICGPGEFRQLLEKEVPLLQESYWPTPWCVESRLQTVIGSIIRSSLLPPVQYRREVLRLSDGGQVALDWAEHPDGEGEGDKRETRAVLLVLPGLTGGAHADYVRCAVAAAHELGAHCVVFNNRGLGGLPLTRWPLWLSATTSLLRRAICAGHITSVCADTVHSLFPHSPVPMGRQSDTTGEKSVTPPTFYRDSNMLATRPRDRC